MTSPEQTRIVAVWDLPTRLFHWLTVALVLAAYATWRLNRMDWHAAIGQALLALVLFRLFWGVAGSDTARFARFLASPRAAIRHLAGLFAGEPDEQVGHNAAGGWMVVLLLALLLGETLTGIVSNNDVASEGPLTERLPGWLLNLIDDLHGWIWTALLTAVVLHVAAIGFYAVRGHRLVPAMATGRKALPAHTPAPRMAPTWRALPILAAAVVAAALIANRL